MIFLYILICLIVVAGLGVGGKQMHELNKTKQTYGISRKELYKLSQPAQRILKAYYALPATNRPDGNMVAILSALDKKHGGDLAVEKHFTVQDYSWRNGRKVYYMTFTWNHQQRCYARDCSMFEYNRLHDALTGIAKDLAAREYELQMAGLAGRLGEAKGMLVALEQERKFIKEDTAAIKKDVMGELE